MGYSWPSLTYFLRSLSADIVGDIKQDSCYCANCLFYMEVFQISLAITDSILHASVRGNTVFSDSKLTLEATFTNMDQL